MAEHAASSIGTAVAEGPSRRRPFVRARLPALVLTVVTAASALATGGCRKRDEPKEQATTEPPKAEASIVLLPGMLAANPIAIGKAHFVEKRSSVAVTGTLEFVPNRVARVGPIIEGRVTSIRVDPGQRVAKGAVLASVDSVEVGRARADYLASQVQVEFAARERTRQYNLADSGLASGQSVLAAENQTDLAVLGKRAAAERLSAVGVRAEDLNAQAEGHASRPSTSTLLKTPLGGLVLDVNARIGQAVSSTDTLFVVGEIDKVWLLVDVYERDLARVHTGDEARARVISYPDREFRGVVDYVSGIVDPVRKSVSARVVLDNPEGLLRPGMSANAHVFSSERGPRDDGSDASAGADPIKRRALVVPKGAIQSIDGQPFVFLDKGAGKFDLRPIQQGDVIPGDHTDDVEVVQGLSDGESIALDNTFILKAEALRAEMGSND